MTENIFGAQTTHVLAKFTVWLRGGSSLRSHFAGHCLLPKGKGANACAARTPESGGPGGVCRHSSGPSGFSQHSRRGSGSRSAQPRGDRLHRHRRRRPQRPRRLLKSPRMPRCSQFSEDRKEPSADLMGCGAPISPQCRSAPRKLGDTARAENWRNPEGASSLGHLSASFLSYSPFWGCSFVTPPISAPNSPRVTCEGISTVSEAPFRAGSREGGQVAGSCAATFERERGAGWS